MWIFLDSTDILVCLEKNVFKVKIELFLRFNKNPEDNFLSAFHLVFFTFSLQSWLSKIQFSSQQNIELFLRLIFLTWVLLVQHAVKRWLVRSTHHVSPKSENSTILTM